tara:strand:- start:2152 stop:2748 length:597 start_codon:yes stop_codon:yes gene_type:complete
MTKKMKIIGVQGVNATGKSTLAHCLSRDFIEYDTVATDNILAINRMLNSDDPRLQGSSYSSWERFGEPTKENIWKGFSEYRKANKLYLDCLLRRSRNQRVGMIIEGLHIEPELFFSYSDDLDIDIFLLAVSDSGVHRERIKQKCDYRPELMVRLDKYFPHVRTLQGLLLKEAEQYPIRVIETGVSMEDSLNQMREHLK